METKKEHKKYRTSWSLADKKTLTCQQIWLIGQIYYDKMQIKKGRARHRIKHTAQLLKLFYWLYLTGSRPTEAFSQPLSIQIDGSYINIKKANARHKGEKTQIIMAMPIKDEYEKNMWNFITDNGIITEAKHIFIYDKWKSTASNNISALFAKNFIANLEDQDKKIHKNQGIIPQILRYARLRNLILEHHVDERVLEQYFGCNIKLMRSKAPQELCRALDFQEQKKILERANQVPTLKLGANIISTY